MENLNPDNLAMLGWAVVGLVGCWANGCWAGFLSCWAVGLGLGWRAVRPGSWWSGGVGLLAVGLLVGFLALLGCCTAGLSVGFFGIVLLTCWALSGLFNLVVFDCWVPLLLLGRSLGLLGHWVVGLLGCWAVRVV